MDTTTSPGLLLVAIREAARALPVAWPLDRFVAVNPLAGLIERPFATAVRDATSLLGGRAFPTSAMLPAASTTHDGLDGAGDDTPSPRPRALTTLERRVPPSEAASTIVEDLVASFLREAVLDSDATTSVWSRCRTPRHARAVRRALGRQAEAWWTAQSDDAVSAIQHSLDHVGVAPSAWSDELSRQFARLPGWTAWAKWCDEWSALPAGEDRVSLSDVAALLLTLDAALLPQDAPALGKEHEFATSDDDALLQRLERVEDDFITDLVSSLQPSGEGPRDVRAQVVMCIDARSEGLRRHLEETGPYDTVGFAGFFGAPVRVTPLAWQEGYDAAPVLLRPDIEVREVPRLGRAEEAAAYVRNVTARVSRDDVSHELSHVASTMFVLAEIGGWASVPELVRRSLRAPSSTADAAPLTDMDLDAALDDPRQWASIAETSLRVMGLTSGFAPLVVLCGHRSSSAANPHAASLDCGACAGHGGAANARIMAAVLNRASVRHALSHRGIDIPDGTWFLAGEHNTTTDDVTIFDVDTVPVPLHAATEELLRDLAAAGRAQSADRVARAPGFGGDMSRADLRRRGRDWAQTRPEWGLANNAGFIVGPREFTRGVDLEGRCFLHSYRPDEDSDGAILEGILTAPMVVAHWINAQYYFSTVSPDVYGAGDKTLHNPVGRVGVIAGEDGDLRLGLPEQSVRFGDTYVHTPQRLTTVVVAPRERVDHVIARTTVLRHLFDGAWVHLVVVDPSSGTWWRRLDTGNWVALSAHNNKESTS